MPRIACLSLFWSLFGWATLSLADESEPARRLPPAAKIDVDFARDVEPILRKFCTDCHGEKKQLSGLRLDLEGAAARGGDAGVAYEPGKSAASLLIKYVAGLDPDVVMPPKGEKLSTDQVAVLRTWIDQGAKWAAATSVTKETTRSTHWSFQPIRRPPEPAVREEGRVRNSIDRFVLARLDAESIAPSPEADRRTLIRRLSLDLLGLPPTPAEVEHFVNDQRSEAYELLVDRLLASPHFGERWGRHWLDLARYADSDGYEKDSGRPHAWRYRNWVIDAINRDLPFDQFTIEQLAGDLLPGATLDQKVATGFHRNTLTNKEGGTDPEEFRVAAVVDRVNTTSAVWLGLTMGCCQCHSHKYDPLAMREYYGMFAFFNQGQEVDLPAPLPDEVDAYNKAKNAYDAAHAPFVAAVAGFEKNQLPGRLGAWEDALDREKLVVWHTLEADSVTSNGGEKFTRQKDGSYVPSGANSPTATYTFSTKTSLEGITAIRLEALLDGRSRGRGPGRAANGAFVLSEFRVAQKTGEADPVPIKLQNARASFEENELPVSAAVDGNVESGWGIAPEFGKDHVAVFETADQTTPGSELAITLDQQGRGQKTLGRFRLSVTNSPPPVGIDGVPASVASILAIARVERTAEQSTALAEWFASQDAEFVKLKRAEAEHARQAPPPLATMAQTLADVAKPRQTHMHIRGDFMRKGDEVSPHTPAVLPALKSDSEKTPNRLDLARWIVSAENPLTARVTVNRIWRHLFGQPLVATMDDFGTRGETASHPELLDWLASEFRNCGSGIADCGLNDEGGTGAWSLKRMVRLIVCSATYRQSSAPRADLVDRDPKNVLLARQNRFRLEAEIIRDTYLAASGLLSDRIGGPSVRPKQPAGISELTYANSVRWVESTGSDRYRRGLYTWFQRTSPYPMLMTFDAPESNIVCTRRERSNTPLQALTLLNDPVFHECAQALGRRLINDRPADAEARLKYVFELCVGRPPADAELARLKGLFADLKTLAAADLKSSAELVGNPQPAEADLADIAASVALARVILNLDEFVTRE